jgi:hypothetical protein
MEKHKQFFQYCINRSTIMLAKGFLECLEDLRDDNTISIDKYAKLRTKVLNGLGDCNRNVDQLVTDFEINLKK